MTATLERPPLRTSVRRKQPERSPLGTGLAAATWAVGAGLVTLGIPLLLAWATDSRSGSGAAAATRSVGQLWLLAHGAALAVPGGHLGIIPLGLTLLPLALLHRAGRHGARALEVRTLPHAARLVVAIALPYSVGCAIVAAVSATHHVRPAPVQAILGGLVVAAVGSTSGVLRETGLRSAVAALLPARVRRLARATAVTTGALLAAGSLLAGWGLVRHASRASALAAATDPGIVGGLALLATGLLCVPNAALWGAAWLAGPGFAVGVGTGVGPFGTTLGQVPALPILAGLPSGSPPTWLGLVLLAVPVGAGALGGVAVGRRLSSGPVRAALEGLAVGPSAGLVMAGAAWFAGGPLGGGRLTVVGPWWWQVGLAVAAEVGVGAAAAACVVRR